MNQQKIIYFNGEFVEAEKAKVSVMTHALQYGTGCFEGIRSYYNEQDDTHYIFRMRDHYMRMQQSAKILFFTLPHSIDELCSITEELIKRNFAPTDTYIRPFLYKKEETITSFNLSTLLDGFTIYTMQMGRYLDTSKGIKVNVSSWQRIHDNAIPARAKISGSYINTALARTESDLLGFQEALFLDTHGHIVEGSAENIFIVKDNTLITPGVSDDILKGITRETIFLLCAQELHLPVVQRSIDRSEVYQADEVFLVGTGAEVTPVVEIDRRKIGKGQIGSITMELKTLYHDLVHGKINKYNEYITKVQRPKK